MKIQLVDAVPVQERESKLRFIFDEIAKANGKVVEIDFEADKQMANYAMQYFYALAKKGTSNIQCSRRKEKVYFWISANGN